MLASPMCTTYIRGSGSYFAYDTPDELKEAIADLSVCVCQACALMSDVFCTADVRCTALSGDAQYTGGILLAKITVGLCNRGIGRQSLQ